MAALCAGKVLGFTSGSGQGFPDGYDAVTAAPKNHWAVFENALVRVLEVTMPPPGQTEPLHHHRWPGFFLAWDTGGKSPHVRYHWPGNIADDSPGVGGPASESTFDKWHR